MSGKKRIALYGGTFDPVHRGHLAVARTISQIFEIDELLFVPAWLAPLCERAAAWIGASDASESFSPQRRKTRSSVSFGSALGEGLRTVPQDGEVVRVP